MKRVLGWIVKGLWYAGHVGFCNFFFCLGTLLGPVWPGARCLRVERRHCEPKAWQSRCPGGMGVL